jgi:hypothetical protein
MMISRHKLICAGLIAIAVAVAGSSADARHRRATHRVSSGGMAVDAWGTPIIMKGYGEGQTQIVPRVSTPVTVPPPSAGLRDLPARQLLQAPAPTYTPPPNATFGDRVTNCIHSYPLNAGVGNNPTEQGAYVRQCANN